MNELLNGWSSRILSILRFITGFLFMWHGMQKLFNFPPSESAGGAAVPAFIIYGAGSLELFGGIFIMLGLFTRPVAFVLSGLMAVAYFMGHGFNAFLPITNQGELAVTYCFIFLYLCFAGGGAWSLDNVLRKKD
ncbi:DoxX family protein [soil metagenome]